MHLPTSLDQPATRPVAPVADNAAGFRDARRQQPSSHIYHGELLDTVSDRSYRPQLNLQVSPENRRAITAYQKIADEQMNQGYQEINQKYQRYSMNATILSITSLFPSLI